MYENRENLLRWLRTLFYIHLTGCLMSALALASTVFTFAVGGWYTWAQRFVSLGIAVCLYLMPGRYSYAGMAKALALLCTLVSLVLFRLLNAYGIQMQGATYMRVLNWLSHGTTVLALVALFLEYTAHAAAAPRDRTKWYIFLGCSLVVAVLSVVSVKLMQPVFDEMVKEGVYRWIKLWNIGARTLSLAGSIVYLILLHRVICAQQEVD